jgi:glycyl-tRNA synthetase beta chain
LTAWLAKARNLYLEQGIGDERSYPDAGGSIENAVGAAMEQVFMLDVRDFLADRLKVQQREAGVRHDLIDAVFALGGEDDLVRLLARVKALQAFMATDDGTNLLAGYKRAANILKQASVPAEAGTQGGQERTSADARPGLRLSPERMTDVDRALLAALDTAEPAARNAVEEERFTDAMAALASLRAPIDAFFDGVMVNDPDEAVRAYRLGLLARFTGAVHGVADFSKIEG